MYIYIISTLKEASFAGNSVLFRILTVYYSTFYYQTEKIESIVHVYKLQFTYTDSVFVSRVRV